MTRTRIAAGIALLAVALFVSSTALGAPPAASGVAAVDEAWKKAVTANDLEAVMACYATDAVAWLPDEPEAKGADAIREGYRSIFAANTVRSAELSGMHYEVHGNRAVGWGRFTLTLEPKSGGGKPITMKGRYSEVAERRGGRWVYVLDHASAEPAPPAAPAPAK